MTPPQGVTSCAWKQSYTPRSGVADCGPQHYQNAPDDNPVVCIDWCDAVAYCAWAGKRLCGKLGSGQSQVPYVNYTNPAESEWMYVCSENGANQYPYGTNYASKRCEGDDSDNTPNNGSSQEPVAVGSHKQCIVNAYPQIVDMSGNVWEWENSCEIDINGDPKDDKCHNRGGSFWDPQDALACGGPTYHRRQSANKNIGIRCCADVIP